MVKETKRVPESCRGEPRARDWGWERTNPILGGANTEMQCSAGQSEEMANDGPERDMAVVRLAKGCQACGCAQAHGRLLKSSEYRQRWTGYTTGTKRKLKSVAAGGDGRVRMGSYYFSEEAIGLMRPGFVQSTGHSCPARGEKAKATSKESAVYSTRLLKISHAEM
jgi:hypothetical protein